MFFPFLLSFPKDTWYQFGDQLSEISDSLLPHYDLPPKEWMRLVNHSALSFGLSGSGCGVPFHTHGAVFAEVIFGMKRWFVAAPENKPLFSGSNTTLFWLRHVLPTIEEKSKIMDGICSRGDLLYLPSFWWHSTLNIGQSVFMSVFI